MEGSTAHCLLLEKNEKELVVFFSILFVVRIPARELVSLPTPPPDTKAPAHTAALVLVDRSMDLIGPALHGQHVLDRAFGILGDDVTAVENGTALSPVRWVRAILGLGYTLVLVL